jgi:hypothetical protein
MKFPIKSNQAIQNTANTRTFSKFSSPSATSMEIIAPTDGYVFFYRIFPGIDIPLETLTHYPAIHESTAGGYVIFVPKRLDYFPHVTRRRFPTITHLACQYAAPPEPGASDDFKIASNLIRNYHINYPSRSAMNFLQVDNDSGRRSSMNFDLSRLFEIEEESTDEEKTAIFDEIGRLFHGTFWVANNATPVMLPVKEGELIYTLQPAYNEVSLSMGNHYRSGGSDSLYFSRFYINVNHYYQILINNGGFTMSSTELNMLHYEFQNGAAARHTLNLPIAIKYEPGEYPNNRDTRIEGVVVRIVGGLQNIDLEIRDWFWGRKIEVPIGILTVGIVEVNAGEYAELVFSQITNHRLINVSSNLNNLYSSQRTVINDTVIEDQNDALEQYSLRFEVNSRNQLYPGFPDQAHIVFHASSSLIDKVGEHVNNIDNIESEYARWLNESCSFWPAKKNIDFVHLFQLIRMMRHDHRIGEIGEEQFGAAYSAFENNLYGEQGYISRVEALVARIMPIFDNDAVFSVFVQEFQFSFDFNNLSQSNVTALENSLQTIEYLYEALQSVDSASNILDRISTQFYSQTIQVPIESAFPCTLSQLYEFAKRSRKLAASSIKIAMIASTRHILKTIRNDGFRHILTTTYRAKYMTILTGFGVTMNGDTPVYTAPLRNGEERFDMGLALKFADAIFAYIDLIIKLNDFGRTGANNNGVEVTLASLKFILKASRLFVSSSSRTFYSAINRGIPGLNIVTAGIDILKAADAISEQQNRGNTEAAFYLRGELIGNGIIVLGETGALLAPLIAAGETVSALALLGPLGAFLIVGGVVICLASSVLLSTVQQSLIEDYIKYGYFGSNSEPLPTNYRLFQDNIDVQVSYLNSIYFPIRVGPLLVSNERLNINFTPTLVTNTSSIAIFLFNEDGVFVDAYLHKLNLSNGQSNTATALGKDIRINTTSTGQDPGVLNFGISIGDYVHGSANVQIDDIDKVLLLVSFGEISSQIDTPRKLSRNHSATSRVEIRK